MKITFKTISGEIKEATIMNRPQEGLFACKSTPRKRKADLLIRKEMITSSGWEDFPVDDYEVEENAPTTEEIEGLCQANELGLDIPNAVIISR